MFRLPRKTWMKASSSSLWHGACSLLAAKQSPLHPDRMIRGCRMLAGSGVYIVQKSGLLPGPGSTGTKVPCALLL